MTNPQVEPRTKTHTNGVLPERRRFTLIEVSDTSLPFDRRRKLPRYAETGIPEVWIIDLARERVYVHREPLDARYQRIETVAPGAVLTPIAFPDLSLSVEELFRETHPE